MNPMDMANQVQALIHRKQKALNALMAAEPQWNTRDTGGSIADLDVWKIDIGLLTREIELLSAVLRHIAPPEFVPF